MKLPIKRAKHYYKNVIKGVCLFYVRVKSGEQWIIGPTTFSWFFHWIFLKHFSLEPARILDFLAPDSICKYQNRQTNLLKLLDLTRVNFTLIKVYIHFLKFPFISSFPSVLIVFLIICSSKCLLLIWKKKFSYFSNNLLLRFAISMQFFLQCICFSRKKEEIQKFYFLWNYCC